MDPKVKQAIYHHFARTGERPSVTDVARAVGAADVDVKDAFLRLRASRVLVLESNGERIRMAPPFSGVPTQHVVVVEGRRYFANCAWDSLGIPAALHAPAVVESRCEQSREPFRLHVGADGPEASDWLFHCAVPAARWWHDIAFT